MKNEGLRLTVTNNKKIKLTFSHEKNYNENTIILNVYIKIIIDPIFIWFYISNIYNI